MRFVYSLIFLICIGSSWAQERLDVELRDRSWFTDQVATAYVEFDSVVEYDEGSEEDGAGCSLLNVEIREVPSAASSRSIAVIRFLPTKVGRVTFPSLAFLDGETRLRSQSKSFVVDHPIPSSEMTLSLTSAKRRVYVGEPVRIDLSWDCGIHAGMLKALRLYPTIFKDPDIEIVVPRNTVADEQQLGLPIGGRRVIATRTLDADNKEHLGRVELTFYMRFTEEGIHSLPSTRLECVLLEKANLGFANYAAYFNNSLFEPADPEEAYRRIYTEAAAMEFEVVPLPEAERPVDFSGLFVPLEITATVDPSTVEIGELMELKIDLSGEAPHGMLELPEISEQRGLRDRFLVDPSASRIWKETGTSFRYRIRALTTTVQALPSLKFNVFNASTGAFETLVTQPIPLHVASVDGQEFLPLKNFGGATIKLTSQPDGVWHNLEASPMNDFFNIMVALANQYFWFLLLIFPIACVLLIPFVRERRRRANNVRYSVSAQAYGVFRREPEGSKKKWHAFLNWLAVSFESREGAWTVGDSQQALRSLGVDTDDIETIARIHERNDAEEFGHEDARFEMQKLGTLAERIRPYVFRGLLMFCLFVFCVPSMTQAGDWEDAQELFQRAIAEPAGSAQARNLLQDAALKFEAAAVDGIHAGEAWYNAGNAWFESGNLGRSIASYRQGQIFRPFDSLLRENLAVARALVRSDVVNTKSVWAALPTHWLKPILLVLNAVFWVSVLLVFRFRNKTSWWFSVSCGTVALLIGVLIVSKTIGDRPEGVVIADVTEARKGPGYNYAVAFNEPLRGGLEFRQIETRSDWIRIELADTRQCWVAATQLQIIE